MLGGADAMPKKPKTRFTEIKGDPVMKDLPAYVTFDVPDGCCPVVLQKLLDGSWDVLRLVDIRTGVCSSSIATCKTLGAAKSWVSRFYNASR